MVQIANKTTKPISGLILVTNSNDQTKLLDIAPGSSQFVSPKISGNENSLYLLDARGNSYFLIGYFEGNPSRTIKATILSQVEQRLIGQIEDHTRYHTNGNVVLEKQK